MTTPPNLLVTDALWSLTSGLFNTYATRRVEAGCFWYGVRGHDRSMASVIGIPRQQNRPWNFEIDADDLANLMEAASHQGLALVAQLHTHPGDDTNHSPYDDSRIVSRKIYSIVLPNYGRGEWNPRIVGVHQFDGTHWRRVAPHEVALTVGFVAHKIDTR
jgi:hypothetical protein